MFAPELFKFSPPRNSWVEKKGEELLSRTVKEQFFNHSVIIVAPDAVVPPQEVMNDLLNDSTYYHIANLPLYTLLHPQFLDFFVRNGSLTLMSIDTHIDGDNCIALTPSGKLVLSLVKEKFQELGLEGTRSRFTDNKFFVTISLLDDSCVPGKKFYERACLRIKTLNLYFNVIAAWEPTDRSACPSNLAAWFCGLGLSVHPCNIRDERNSMFDMLVPMVEDNVMDVIEWAGMVAVNGKMLNETDSERALSLYEVPEPNQKYGQISYCQLTGLFTSQRLLTAIEKLRIWAATRGSSAWVLVSVQGFDDSVVVRGHQEHYFYTEGDNSYTALFVPNTLPITVSYLSSSQPPRKRFPTRTRRRKRANERRSKRLKSKKRA